MARRRVTEETPRRERRINLVGAGGVGFWTAVGLSRSGIEGIHIYDDDDLTGGLGHSRLPLATPTTRKVDLLLGFLRVSLGGHPPTIHAERFTGREVQEGDWVIDCTDLSGVDRAAIWKRARRGGARCIRVSYDGANSTVVMAEGLPLTSDEAHAGYSNVPTLGLSLLAGGLAAIAITKIIEGKVEGHVEFQISVDELLGIVIPAMA